MIGVIVWSSAAKQKAVVWCEDQGALAYLQGRDNVIGKAGWPEAGDMIALETEVRGELRHAFNVRVIEERKCSDLPSLLRGVGAGGGAGEGQAASTSSAAKPQKAAAARPQLRVVASQDSVNIEPDAFREKHPALFAVKSAGKLR
ncbi:hypothetical protein [Paracoccus sp. (in: a-proteobacteria)]|uniref:hypothetical protein n=1 Tax=Paracoccus sp. TaxID=267 RepID=UPI0028A02FE8|nr:hypothetical protein [Paracoccus sp. (in: a-proteobacteria)]